MAKPCQSWTCLLVCRSGSENFVLSGVMCLLFGIVVGLLPCFVCLLSSVVCLLPREQSWQKLSPIGFLLTAGNLLILGALTHSGWSSLAQDGLDGFNMRVASPHSRGFDTFWLVLVGSRWVGWV